MRDYGTVIDGTFNTSENLAAYNAFRLMVNSTPPIPGTLEVNISYLGSGGAYGVYALASLPLSGTVDIPFSSFAAPPSFPAIDFTQIHSVELTFRGNFLAPGTYVFDNFEAVTVPEPGTVSILLAGFLALAFKGRRLLAN